MKPEKNMTVISNDKGFTNVRKKNYLDIRTKADNEHGGTAF